MTRLTDTYPYSSRNRERKEREREMQVRRAAWDAMQQTVVEACAADGGHVYCDGGGACAGCGEPYRAPSEKD